MTSIKGVTHKNEHRLTLVASCREERHSDSRRDAVTVAVDSSTPNDSGRRGDVDVDVDVDAAINNVVAALGVGGPIGNDPAELYCCSDASEADVGNPSCCCCAAAASDGAPTPGLPSDGRNPDELSPSVVVPP